MVSLKSNADKIQVLGRGDYTYFGCGDAPSGRVLIFTIFSIGIGSGLGGDSTNYVTGACHFARKIGTHNSVDSGGFYGHNSTN